jgi:tRNA threonylcarbamoyladenosine biosynthesis protein TsaB
MVQQLLSEAGVGLAQLDGIVFGRGPGSFTGVRIGVGVTQGLAFGADIPVYGVSTLAAMAQAAARLHSATQVIAAIDARMAEVYIARFALNDTLSNALMQAQSEEVAIKPDALSAFSLSGPVMGVGTGWQTYARQLSALQHVSIANDILYPSAQDMLTLALPALASGAFIAAEHAEPVYVRDEAGNVTKLSPHNEKGEWEYFSRNVNTGKVVRVNMEEMVKDIEKLTGKKYIKEE